MNYRQTGFIAFTGLLCLALAATVSSLGGPVSGMLLVGLGLMAAAITPALTTLMGRTSPTPARIAATVREK